MDDKQRMNFNTILNNSKSQVRLVMNIPKEDYEREVSEFKRDNGYTSRYDNVDFDKFVPFFGSADANIRKLTRRNGKYEVNLFLYNVDFFNFIKPDAKMDVLEKIVEIYDTEDVSHFGRVEKPSNVYMFMKPDAVLVDSRAGDLQKRVDFLVKGFEVFNYNDFV